MAEIVNFYEGSFPDVRLIGKRYFEADRIDGSFGAKWGEWFQNGWFEQIESLGFAEGTFDDSGAYLGFMREKEGEPFEYWIGLFAPQGTAAPDGFEYMDLSGMKMAVTWVKGKENEVYAEEGACYKAVCDKGYEIAQDSFGANIFIERYACPRFTTPDSDGNIILDVCICVK